uniref:Uncharacterized protein n=2 Tax=Moniliophthora roreri TaxID=221103 RepID=A0A0W0G6L6_MONRR
MPKPHSHFSQQKAPVWAALYGGCSTVPETIFRGNRTSMDNYESTTANRSSPVIYNPLRSLDLSISPGYSTTTSTRALSNLVTLSPCSMIWRQQFSPPGRGGLLDKWNG